MFDIGQIITFDDNGEGGYMRNLAAVVIDAHRAVVLDAEQGAALAANSAYAYNRGWFLRSPAVGGDEYEYNQRLLDDPTDDQIATAMHILLTGYVPGIDDA